MLTHGRRFRTLNVLDDYNRELLGVEIDFSLSASRVVQVLTRLVECGGHPTQLRPDNDPEFISAKLSEWCEQQSITLHWIQPGKPTQHTYIERFNGSFRRELLDAHLFRSLATSDPARLHLPGVILAKYYLLISQLAHMIDSLAMSH